VREHRDNFAGRKALNFVNLLVKLQSYQNLDVPELSVNVKHQSWECFYYIYDVFKAVTANGSAEFITDYRNFLHNQIWRFNKFFD